MKKVSAEELSVQDLVVDVSCQREHVNWHFVRKIADNWDWALCQPLDVVRNGAGYTVLDGQHRLLAARRAGISKLPCRVHSKCGDPERSRLFLDLNEQRHGVGARDKLRNKASTGDSRYVEAVEILRRYGLAVSKQDTGMRLTCAAAVSHIIEKYGAERLKEAMLFVEKAWPNDPRRFQGWILRGVAAFQEQLWGLEPSGTLAAYKNLVSTARQKIGARFTLKDVITKAQERFPYRPHGEQAVCQALVDLYNWRRRNHRI